MFKTWLEAIEGALQIQWLRFNRWLDLRKENPGKKCGVVHDKRRGGFVEYVETKYGPGEYEAVHQKQIEQQKHARRLWTPEQHEQERRRAEKRQTDIEAMLKK